MRKLHGVIVSNIMQKTVVVRVDRLARHPKYHKYQRISRTFKADVNGKEWSVGDSVLIGETRPVSREKRWTVIELVKKAVSESEHTEEENQNV